MPYGPLLLVTESKCINHVTKRMGTALRSLQKEYKGTLYTYIDFCCYFCSISIDEVRSLITSESKD